MFYETNKSLKLIEDSKWVIVISYTVKMTDKNFNCDTHVQPNGTCVGNLC